MGRLSRLLYVSHFTHYCACIGAVSAIASDWNQSPTVVRALVPYDLTKDEVRIRLVQQLEPIQPFDSGVSPFGALQQPEQPFDVAPLGASTFGVLPDFSALGPLQESVSSTPGATVVPGSEVQALIGNELATILERSNRTATISAQNGPPFRSTPVSVATASARFTYSRTASNGRLCGKTWTRCLARLIRHLFRTS